MKGKSEGNYQWMGVFVVWNYMVERAVLIYKRFRNGKDLILPLFSVRIEESLSAMSAG